MMSDKQYRVARKGIVEQLRTAQKLHCKHMEQKYNEVQIINYSEDYRIKPKCRPFKNAEECWAEMQKHQPFGWVKDCKGSKFVIGTMNSSDSSIFVSDEGAFYSDEMFEKFTFADGAKFGVKEEE